MIFIAIGILHISVTFFRTTIEIRVLVTFEMFWKRDNLKLQRFQVLNFQLKL